MEADALKKALDTGAATTAVKHVATDSGKTASLPFVVLPAGYGPHSLEDLLLDPVRVKQSVMVFDAKSFTDYFTEYCNPSSRIFVDVSAPTIVGVIDYHEQGIAPKAEWGSHRLIYQFRNTIEWKTWTAFDKKPMNQAQFAAFIEDNLPDIREPNSATMLELSRTLEAKKGVNFSSSVRLSNGETQFTYEEEIRGTAGKGTIDIPNSFILALAPFEGLDTYRVEARFRYSIGQGGLQLRYELVRPHKFVEDAVKTVVETIRGGVNNPVTFGSL